MAETSWLFHFAKASQRGRRANQIADPDRRGFEWKQVMVFGRGLEANDASQYTLTGENDLALNFKAKRPTVNGVPVRSYNAAKTVADCVKRRRK